MTDGATAVTAKIFYAIGHHRKGHIDTVELLLRAAASVDAVGMYSWTPLLVRIVIKALTYLWCSCLMGCGKRSSSFGIDQYPRGLSMEHFSRRR